jgi:hypothetical protein
VQQPGPGDRSAQPWSLPIERVQVTGDERTALRGALVQPTGRASW